MNEPCWVGLSVALAIHKRQVEEHGGSDGVRDIGLLESALARPRNPFLDGNKRVAYVVARTFMLLNGHDIVAPQEEKYTVMMAVASGRITESELADWFAAHLVSVE